MAIEVDRKLDSWRNYLSRGQWTFSEGLLTPGIAIVISPDGNKSVVIGDARNDSLDEYDEQDKVAYVSFCNGGSGTPFQCPECQRFYRISDGVKDISFASSDDIKSIPTTARSFHCDCGDVLFALTNRYEFLHLPFFLVELELLHCLFRMPRTADLFVRYLLSPEGHKLVEEVGVVTYGNVTGSTTFRFLGWAGEWQTGPSFVSDSFHAYPVELWRTRTYQLGSDTFEERTYHGHEGIGWDTVWRQIGQVPDLYALESLRDLVLTAGSVIPPRDVDSLDNAAHVEEAVALPAEEREQIEAEPPRKQRKLGPLLKHYEDVCKQWKAAKEIYKDNRNRNWEAMVRLEHPTLPVDLVKRLDPRAKLPDEILTKLAEKGGTSQPGEIALEHAARLCGAADYRYSIGHLWTVLGEQRKPYRKNTKV